MKGRHGHLAPDETQPHGPVMQTPNYASTQTETVGEVYECMRLGKMHVNVQSRQINVLEHGLKQGADYFYDPCCSSKVGAHVMFWTPGKLSKSIT